MSEASTTMTDAQDLPAPVVRGKGGRWVSSRCPDPNCGGSLTILEDGWWACDGLTHKGDHDELEACRYMVQS